LLYDPERRWLDRASCRTVEPERFFAASGGQVDKSPSPANQALWNKAKRVCRFCPVLEQCRRDTLGEEYGVWGGKDEHERYLERKKISRGRWKKWPEETRLAWGEHLAWLRNRGVSWREIGRRTGFTINVCEALIEQWRADKSQRSQEAVTEKPARVIEGLTLREFPDVPGQRHMWVRHNGRVSDGWYAGETKDGAWIRVQVWSGRGNVFKWVQPTDLKIYNAQTPFHIRYVGRAARERAAAEREVA
jgi:WhiB family redox-sensing transcriptional regulator